MHCACDRVPSMLCRPIALLAEFRLHRDGATGTGRYESSIQMLRDHSNRHTANVLISMCFRRVELNRGNEHSIFNLEIATNAVVSASAQCSRQCSHTAPFIPGKSALPI